MEEVKRMHLGHATFEVNIKNLKIDIDVKLWEELASLKINCSVISVQGAFKTKRLVRQPNIEYREEV